MRSAEQLYLQAILDLEQPGWVDETQPCGDPPRELRFRLPQTGERVWLDLRFNGGDPTYYPVRDIPARLDEMLIGIRPAWRRPCAS